MHILFRITDVSHIYFATTFPSHLVMRILPCVSGKKASLWLQHIAASVGTFLALKCFCFLTVAVGERLKREMSAVASCYAQVARPYL